MTKEALQTLFHPFEADILEWPLGDALFLGAEPGFRPPGADRPIFCVQGFRPHYLALRKQGAAVVPLPEGEDYGTSLVLCGRYRSENEARLVEALRRTRPGGLVVVGGGKTDGVASLRKRLGGLCAIEGSASKYHGVVFWLRRPDDEAVGGIASALAPEPGLVGGRFVTGPGMFSGDAIDPASRLLAESLPADTGGAVADFCAGWGYLAARLAEREQVRRIDLYEAGYEALEAAKINLRDEASRLLIGFHWHDLSAEPVDERYDAIVMNPPFHQGRAAEPDLGLRMIAAAREALRPGGRLFLVANKGLPYERALAEGFRSHGETARDSSYKVLWAVR